MKELSKHYYLGVDLGSTTAKYVLMDSKANILRKSYVRHQSAVVEVLIKELSALSDFAHAPLTVNFTGSAALNLAESLNVPFVQEVIAASTYLKSGPETVDVAIELGGEDGKIIFLSNGVELRMNEACAGGTGAFIDQMATLLNVSTPELNELAKKAQQIHPIASRCGVFAKTDLVALLNQGVSKADIAKSVFAAVCEQTISGLACGREIVGNVSFLGGPLSFLTELKQSFIDKLSGPCTKFLEFTDTQYAIAYGAARAALKAEQQQQNLQATPCLDVHHPARSRSNSSSESTAIREPASSVSGLATDDGHSFTSATPTTTIAALLEALQSCRNTTTSSRLSPLFTVKSTTASASSAIAYAATDSESESASAFAANAADDADSLTVSEALDVAADTDDIAADDTTMETTAAPDIDQSDIALTFNEHTGGAHAGADSYGSTESYSDFVKRHAAHSVVQKDLSTASGPLYLGIDLGSTTIKLVLINEQRELLASFYAHNGGEPLRNLMPKVKELVHNLPHEAYIAAICTTGYGAELAKAALNAQFSEVETLAHQKAAVAFDPEVTYVIDIGGQDMKCIKVDHGVIASIQLNEACSSGCGSFLETFAAQLQLPLPEFVKQALEAQAPCDLGTRCTVFMNSKVKQAQRDNVAIGDIAAGLCLSIVRNALYKVLRIHDSAELGEHVVVQGGTFLNDAILRAFELNIGRDVIRPNIAGLMGAFGSALIAQERCVNKDRVHALTFPDELFDLSKIKTRDFRCKGCNNHCMLTMNTFLSGQKHIHGNRCDFPLNHSGRVKDDQGNFYERKFKLLFERPILFSKAQHAQAEAEVEAQAQAQAKAHAAALEAAQRRRAALQAQAAAKRAQQQQQGTRAESAAVQEQAQHETQLQASAAALASSVAKAQQLKKQYERSCTTGDDPVAQSAQELEAAEAARQARLQRALAVARAAKAQKQATAAAAVAAATANAANAAAASATSAASATTSATATSAAQAATAAPAAASTAGTVGNAGTVVPETPATPAVLLGNQLVIPADVAVATRGSIGIPRVLNIFEHYPFWHALFNELHFNVVLSPVSTKEISSLGQTSIPSQSLCLPAKLAHGHITYLAEQGVKRIFLPCVPKEDKYFAENDDSFACPVVGGYPEALKLNLQSLYPELKLYTPYLLLGADKSIIKAIQEIDPSIKKKEILNAIEVARDAMRQYHHDLCMMAIEQVELSQKQKLPLVVLSGHPYHVDPLLNHGIPALIASMGTVIVSEDAIAMLTQQGPKLDVVNQWAFHSRLYRAAQYVIEHQNSQMVQLVSFGCGIDAITSEQVKKILESHHKIYTMLKIDEGDTLGAAKIRLRSLLCATADANAAHPATATTTANATANATIAAPAPATGSEASSETVSAVLEPVRESNLAAAALAHEEIAHIKAEALSATNSATTVHMVEGQLQVTATSTSANSCALPQSAKPENTMTLAEAMSNDALKERTLYMPQMAPIHFPILATCLRSLGYKVKLLDEVSSHAIEMGLKHVNNDACYPAIVAIGQLLEPVAAGQIDPQTSALLLAQTCGPCRATNYPALLNWALHDLHAQDIPVVTLQGSDLQDEKLHLKLGLKGLKRLTLSLLYGDLLQSLYLHCHTYEQVPGTSLKLVQHYHHELNEEVLSKPKQFKRRVHDMVSEFSRIPLRHELRPKVGIVGEILLKYHPDANSELVENIIAEGGEPVLGDISAFVLYCLHDSIYQAQHLGTSKLKATVSWLLLRSFEAKRRIIISALKNSKFEPLPCFSDLMRYGSKFVSLGQQAGEGWLLTAEMVDFIEHRIENIICVQPFACLPNHITGKGVMRALRETYAQANLCSIDYEAGSAQSNVLNRIKLFITQAKDNLIAQQQAQQLAAQQAQQDHAVSAAASRTTLGATAVAAVETPNFVRGKGKPDPFTQYAHLHTKADNDEQNFSRSEGSAERGDDEEELSSNM